MSSHTLLCTWERKKTHKCIELSAPPLEPGITIWTAITVSQCKEREKKEGNGEREDKTGD